MRLWFLTPAALEGLRAPLADPCMAGVGAVLLVPSTYHGVLAVKGCACLARWRPAAVVDP